MKVHSAAPQSPYKSVWLCVVQTLSTVTDLVRERACKTTGTLLDSSTGNWKEEDSLLLECRQQLLEAPGGLPAMVSML